MFALGCDRGGETIQWSVSFTSPSTVLRALTAASHLMANHDEDLKEAINALINATAFFIDEQSKEAEDRERKRREKAQEEHEGPGAIEEARKVAKILIERGGDAARVALGLPLQTPSNKREYEPSLLKHTDYTPSGP
jgi:uncharacterized protein (DUF1501 family)